MGRSPEQMRRSPEQVRRLLEQESGPDPTEYEPRSTEYAPRSFEPGTLRLPSTSSPANRPRWRTPPEQEIGIDFARFDPHVMPEPPQSGRRLFAMLAQVVFGLLVVAACGYFGMMFLEREA